jgi:hypothetical protein
MHRSGKHQAGKQVNGDKQIPTKRFKIRVIVLRKTSSSKIHQFN